MSRNQLSQVNCDTTNWRSIEVALLCGGDKGDNDDDDELGMLYYKSTYVLELTCLLHLVE